VSIDTVSGGYKPHDIAQLGSTRPSIALGRELDVVTMVALGGISIDGGSGSILGVALAAFVMGLVAVGLLNVPGIIMSIINGFRLVAAIALPALPGRLSRRRVSGARS
jgi:rhamnose transport system permease protein